MPRKGDGKSLREFSVTGWFGAGEGSPGVQLTPFTVKASNLQGAVGRAAREGRKQVGKGRFTQATINVESV